MVFSFLLTWKKILWIFAAWVAAVLLHAFVYGLFKGFFDKKDKTFNPSDICFSSLRAVMESSNFLSYLIKKPRVFTS